MSFSSSKSQSWPDEFGFDMIHGLSRGDQQHVSHREAQIRETIRDWNWCDCFHGILFFEKREDPCPLTVRANHKIIRARIIESGLLQSEHLDQICQLLNRAEQVLLSDQTILHNCQEYTSARRWIMRIFSSTRYGSHRSVLSTGSQHSLFWTNHYHESFRLRAFLSLKGLIYICKYQFTAHFCLNRDQHQ